MNSVTLEFISNKEFKNKNENLDCFEICLLAVAMLIGLILRLLENHSV